MYDRLQSLHTEAAGQCPGLVSRPALLLLLFSLAAGEAWEVRQTAGTGRGGRMQPWMPQSLVVLGQ